MVAHRKRRWLGWRGASCRPTDTARAKTERERKKNLSEVEIQVILGEVKVRKKKTKQNISLLSLSSGATQRGKAKACREVMLLCPLSKNLSKKWWIKWFHMKLDAKKKHAYAWGFIEIWIIMHMQRVEWSHPEHQKGEGLAEINSLY